MDQWSDATDLQKATSPADGAESHELPDDSTASNGSALIHDEIAVPEDADHGDVPSLPPPVQTFPKEFNKNHFAALDRRYLTVLILTLLLELLLIRYLLQTHPPRSGGQDMARLQNKYAELFLSEFKVENAPAPETDILSRAAETVPQILEDVAGGLPGVAGSGKNLKLPRLRPNRGNAGPEARGLSGENRDARRRLNTATRQRGMQALTEEVERIGLLGVITAGSSGLVSRAPVSDILQYADSTIGDIDNALAQVRQLRVPRAGVDYFGTGAGSEFGAGRGGFAGGFPDPDAVHIEQKEVRGGRTASSGVQAEEIVTGLAVAPQKTIERNRQFEPVASTPSLLPAENAAAGGIAGFRGRTVKGPATRDRERIREIVLAHSPAIQDCYRRQLKGNPTLKGKVAVRFTVDPLGHVSEVEIVKSDMTAAGVFVQLPPMEECILTKIRKWRDFGRVDEAQGEVTFRQTYNFGY